MTAASAPINLREIGGSGFQRGRARVILRSNTEAGTADDYPTGIATVVDLRRNDEVEALIHPLQDLPGYRRAPLFDPSTAESADPRADLEALYIDWLERHRATIADVFRAIATAGPGDVLVCCSAGKDRTGLVSLLLARLWGADLDSVGADYAETGPRLVARFAREVEESDDPAFTRKMHRCEPSTAITIARHIDDRFGSARGYLRAVGLRDDEIAAL